jgi:hypothetical protein
LFLNSSCHKAMDRAWKELFMWGWGVLRNKCKASNVSILRMIAERELFSAVKTSAFDFFYFDVTSPNGSSSFVYSCLLIRSRKHCSSLIVLCSFTMPYPFLMLF